MYNISGDSLCFEANPVDLLPPPVNGRIASWVQTPNIRGTWDIIWTCLVTVFLCTHVILCLNVPAPSESLGTLLLRRIKWMAIAILAPEMVLTYAAGQWSRARQSVAAFHQAYYTQWSMRMAFFADMGGFLLETSDQVVFPLNAKQLHWLIVNTHLDCPKITDAEIWDKSKQDSVTKGIAAFQIGYFMLHCIGRAAQRLPLTTMELNALAIVVCSLMTALTWLHKPADVHTPVRLYSRSSVVEITAGRAWRHTPLDFVDPNLPGWSMNIMPFMGVSNIPPVRPIQRIPNDRFPTDPYGVQEYALFLATLVFTAIHIAGWDFSFPSSGEQLLWRICSIALFAVTGLFWILEIMTSWYRLGRWRRFYGCLVGRDKLRRFEMLAGADMASTGRDLAELPLPREFWIISPIALLYGLARLYLIVEAFAEFRNLDAEIFLTADWDAYVPHI